MQFCFCVVVVNWAVQSSWSMIKLTEKLWVCFDFKKDGCNLGNFVSVFKSFFTFFKVLSSILTIKKILIKVQFTWLITWKKAHWVTFSLLKPEKILDINRKKSVCYFHGFFFHILNQMSWQCEHFLGLFLHFKVLKKFNSAIC